MTRCALVPLLVIVLAKAAYGADQNISVSAPVMTDALVKSAPSALKSVVRVVCTSAEKAGTGFLHQSEWIVTAAYVVSNYKTDDIAVIAPDGTQFKLVDQRIDEN